jgi:hypothetical protein
LSVCLTEKALWCCDTKDTYSAVIVIILHQTNQTNSLKIIKYDELSIGD